jgi:hypothetical protein
MRSHCEPPAQGARFGCSVSSARAIWATMPSVEAVLGYLQALHPRP